MNDRVSIALEAGVADVRLTRSDKMNALDPAMFEAIIAAIARLSAMPGLRAVVLSGEGRGFCAGLDMASMADAGAGVDLMARTHGAANDFQQVAWGWRTLPVPVIAALHGVALAAGCRSRPARTSASPIPRRGCRSWRRNGGWCRTWRASPCGGHWCATMCCAN